MSDEEDWFERAVGEDASADDASAESDASDERDDETGPEDDVGDGEEPGPADEGAADTEVADSDQEAATEKGDKAATETGDEDAVEFDTMSAGAGDDFDGGGFGGLDGSGGLAGEDFGEDDFGGDEYAGDDVGGDDFGRTDAPGRDEDTGASGGLGGGDETEASDPFGGAPDADGADDDPFGDDFAAAMENAPGGAGGAAGFGGGGGGPEFDEESFESDIDRIDIGIEGLDEMVLGGIPDRSLMAVIGSAGTGKTTFALQFLNEALANGGNAVYLTLEESEEAILSTAEEKGWEYRRYDAEDRLAVIAMDPIEMANSLDSIRDDISRLVTDFGADRLVLDSVSLLEMMYDHPSKRRSEVFDFARSLKAAGVTTMLTSEASRENAFASRHGIVEYLADAVFILQYVRPSDFRETRLAVEIQKIRDANHSRETKPYEITNDGISVYRQANIF